MPSVHRNRWLAMGNQGAASHSPVHSRCDAGHRQHCCRRGSGLLLDAGTCIPHRGIGHTAPSRDLSLGRGSSLPFAGSKPDWQRGTADRIVPAKWHGLPGPARRHRHPMGLRVWRCAHRVIACWLHGSLCRAKAGTLSPPVPGGYVRALCTRQAASGRISTSPSTMCRAIRGHFAELPSLLPISRPNPQITNDK